MFRKCSRTPFKSFHLEFCPNYFVKCWFETLLIKMFITFFFLFYLCECNKFPEIVTAFAYHSGDLEKKKENDRSRFSRKNLVCLKMVKKGQKWAQNWVFLAFITRNLQWKTLQFSVFICKSHVWKNSGTIGKYSGKELSLPPPPEGWGRGGGGAEISWK